jgi:two-component system chemotaxis response regulator CheY
VNILLVDPSTETRRAQRAVVAMRPGWRIAECGSGTEALSRCRASCPDLILVSGSLPDMDGLELIRGFRRIAPAGSAVILDEDGSRARVIDALRAGADNFVAVPWTPDLLSQRLDETLSRRGADKDR